jgi:hypothetical protein
MFSLQIKKGELGSLPVLPFEWSLLTDFASVDSRLEAVNQANA